MKKYDLIVIGAGSGGIGAGGIANRLGLDVLMITGKAFDVGGDCLNYGCVPSKAMIHISRLFHAGREAKKFGLETQGKADFQKVLDYIHGQQQLIRDHENPEHFRERDMDVEVGWAKFIDKKTISVNGKEFTAKKIVLATGSIPRELEVEGVEMVEELHTNETIFYNLKKLPERLLVIGGGPIGCELGQAMSRLGSKVTIVNRGDQIMGKERTDFRGIMMQLFEKEGITVINEASVKSFSDKNTAHYTKENGERGEVKFDAVLVSIGRIVRTKGMDLEKAGIEVKDGKIVVDDYYRSTNKNVFVVGDAMGREQFSHGAEMHNRDLIVNFMSPFPLRKHSLENFSWVTYTDPEVATFGWTEKDLKDKNIDYTLIEQDFTEDDRAITADYQSYSKLVLYLSKKTLFNRTIKILGGTMMAPHAGELIQELLTANITGMDVNVIFNKVYPYPVASRINQKAITQHRQGDLTEGLKGILQFLFRNF